MKQLTNLVGIRYIYNKSYPLEMNYRNYFIAKKSMHIFFLILIIGLKNTFPLFSQNRKCNFEKNDSLNISMVNTTDIYCIAKQNQAKTILYTFGIWCEPCILHLANAYQIAITHEAVLYILMIDEGDSPHLIRGINFLRERYPNIKILVLSDIDYPYRRTRKYKKFLKEITPKTFKNSNGMSKYILLDNSANVQMVTNWKDNKGNDWKDDSKMTQKKILPLLKRRETKLE